MKHADSLRYHLHHHLAGRQPGRSMAVVHASDVTKEDPAFCARQHVLHDLEGIKPPDELLTTSQAVTFALGRVVQDLVAGWFADMKMAFGNWKCLACGYLFEFQRRPVECVETCGSKAFAYQEMRFESRLSGTSCGVDLLLMLPGRDKLVPVEVKSEQKDEFKRLAAPRAEHLARTSWYLRLIAESTCPSKKEIDTSEARLLYVVKGGWGQKGAVPDEWRVSDGTWSPFKEFVVKRNDELTQHYHDLAEPVLAYRRGGVVPRGICATQFERRAKSCAAVHACFSGKYPAGSKA